MSGFLPQSPIIRLGGYLAVSWFSGTHQLSYETRIFLLVSRFSFSVSLIVLEGFLLDSHFSLIISCLVELVSEKEGNYNNIIFKVESSWSRSHGITTIIWNFTLVSLTSTITSYPVWLLFGATVSFHPTYSTFYRLDSSLSMPPGWSSAHIPAGKTFRLGIYFRLFTCQSMQLLSSSIT